MAEYIERRTAIEHLNVWCGGCGSAVECILAEPAADVAPVVHGRKIEDGQLVEVVRCRDCKHSCEDLGSLYCCSFGPCVYSSVSPDFWCANGKRREDAHAQD
jgi:hypothetical protein